MKALFIGGKLHGQQRNDTKVQRYVYKDVILKKTKCGKGWKPEYSEKVIHIRHETLPVYRLERYVPTEDGLE